MSPVAVKTDQFEVTILQDSFSRHTKTNEICFLMLQLSSAKFSKQSIFLPQ